MRPIALGLAAVLAACGPLPSDIAPPSASDFADPPVPADDVVMAGGSVTCNHTVTQTWLPEGGPYTSGSCTFACVRDPSGQTHRFLTMRFERNSVTDGWRIVGYDYSAEMGCAQ